MTTPEPNSSAGIGPDAAADSRAKFGDPTVLRNIFRLMCLFCGYLLCVEVMTVVFRWGGLTQGLLRFFPYCVFLFAFVHYARLVTKPDRKNLLMMLFLASVFVIFLLDVTKRLDRFKGIPVLGPDSTVRTDLKSVCEMVALSCFCIGSYFTLVETSQARARLQQEMEKLRLAEAALRKSEERFRLLIENATDLIVVVREDGVLVYLSPSAKRVLGYQPEELEGRDTFEFIHPDDRNRIVAALRRGAQRPAMPRNEQCRLRHKDNTWRLLEGAGRLMSVDANGRNHFVVNLRDVTEQKWLEELLRQAQKMEAVGQLAGGVAHDFNNVLSAILLHLGLLQQDPHVAPEFKAALKEIEMGVNRAATLTKQLLLFSRRAVTQVKPLDLNGLLDNLLKMLRRVLGEHITLEFQGKGNLPLIAADAGMMEQVVMNLSVNARDAMPKSGRLTISTGVVDIDQGAASTEARPGKFVCLTISDTGCGMDEATLKRVFEPFFTTKEVGQGTGLGLAIVYGIVKQHQGWTEIETAVGQGSTFRIFLPVAAETGQPESPAASTPAVQTGTETILLVEDDPALRQVAGRALLRNGYRVLEAPNGVDALRLWQRYGQQIDLLFTDIIMPEGVTGLDLADRLRSEKDTLRVLLTSGYSPEMSTQVPPADGRFSYLAKPYEPTALAAAVRECLDKGSGASEEEAQSDHGSSHPG